jgi:PAS domain S-box-containing protein
LDGTTTIDPLAAPESQLLSLSQDLLGAVGPDGMLTVVNPAWSACLGFGKDQLRAVAFLDLVEPEDRGEAERLLAADVPEEVVCRMRCADGGERRLAWRAARGAEPGVVYLAGRDITELERASADLQDFAYVASHDLAEPLRMVTAYLELLQRRYGGELDETADEFIGYAVDGAERMKVMIDALLAYSRVGTHLLRPVPFDLRELLGDRTPDGVVLAEPLVAIRADPGLAAQLLHQLIDNALKFRDPDREPVVIVSAREDDGGVRIDVADNGIGIAEGQQARIFNMFARLHGRDEYAGPGMGLAVCRRIAERHGGRLTVRSEPGVGSVFSVWVPA